VGCISGDDKSTKENTSIGIIRVDDTFAMIDGDVLQPYLDKLELLKKDENDGFNGFGILSTTRS